MFGLTDFEWMQWGMVALILLTVFNLRAMFALAGALDTIQDKLDTLDNRVEEVSDHLGIDEAA
jgi:hypothetical protein